jgi:hypothetical protein
VGLGKSEVSLSSTFEIIDLVNPNLKCDTVANFPSPTIGSVGFLHNGVPMICGGKPEDGDTSGDCWILEQQGDWKLYNTMSEPKWYHTV